MIPLMYILVGLPIIGAFLSLAAGRKGALMILKAFSLATLAVALYAIYAANEYGIAGIGSSVAYILPLGVNLALGLSGISLILIVMTSIVFFAAALASGYFIDKSMGLYGFLFMLMEATTIGLFASSNLFLFFVFWEVSEVAMFFVIYIYGGMDRRRAAVKFLVYSVVASMLLLIGIMLLYRSSGSFDISVLQGTGYTMSHGMQLLTFAMLLIPFIIKAPVFPLHAWLPDAHTEAPATGSMVLAGVLLKFGGYGMLLLFSILPEIANEYSVYLAALFAISAIYGAMNAIKVPHLKRMIAYTSIADMGIVAFGLAALNSYGNFGAAYIMLSHGLAISLLFMLAGMFDKEFGTLVIKNLGGIAEWSGAAAYSFIIGILATIGIPLTSGFIGDILLFIGASGAFGIVGIVPLAASIIVGAYLFWIVERSIFRNNMKRETYSEYIDTYVLAAAIVLIASLVAFGVLPSLFGL